MKIILPYLALICLGLAACVNDLKKVEAINTKGSGVEIARHIETYYYGPGGKLKGRLTSPLLYRYLRDTPLVELNEGLRVDFYNDSSTQVQSVLTAKKGRYFESTNDIIVSDSVVVQNREGRRLDCEELHWDPKKQQFYTDKPVTITTPTQVIYGAQGMVANQDFTWYQIKRSSGEIQVDSSFTQAPAGGAADSTEGSPPLPGKVQPVTDTLRPKK